MTAKKGETTADIIAEMREAYRPERPPCYELWEGPCDPWLGYRRIPQTLLTLADRLEAAERRKRRKPRKRP